MTYGIIMIFLLLFINQAYPKTLVANHTSNTQDNLVNALVNKLLLSPRPPWLSFHRAYLGSIQCWHSTAFTWCCHSSTVFRFRNLFSEGSVIFITQIHTKKPGARLASDVQHKKLELNRTSNMQDKLVNTLVNKLVDLGFKVLSLHGAYLGNMTLVKPGHFHLGFTNSWAPGLVALRRRFVAFGKNWEGEAFERNAGRESMERGRMPPGDMGREYYYPYGKGEFGKREYGMPEYRRRGMWDEGNSVGGNVGRTNFGRGKFGGVRGKENQVGDMILTGGVNMVQRLAGLGVRLIGVRGLFGLMILVGLAGMLGQIALAGAAVVTVAGVASGGKALPERIKKAATAATAVLTEPDNSRELPDKSGLQRRVRAAATRATALEGPRYSPDPNYPGPEKGSPPTVGNFYEPGWGAPPAPGASQNRAGSYGVDGGAPRWEASPVAGAPPNPPGPYNADSGAPPGSAYRYNQDRGAPADPEHFFHPEQGGPYLYNRDQRYNGYSEPTSESKPYPNNPESRLRPGPRYQHNPYPRAPLDDGYPGLGYPPQSVSSQGSAMPANSEYPRNADHQTSPNHANFDSPYRWPPPDVPDPNNPKSEVRGYPDKPDQRPPPPPPKT